MGKIVVGLFAAATLLGANADQNAKIRARAIAIEWSTLRGLNPETGELSPPMKKRMGQPLKIKGYAIPLEASGKGVSSILLVSDPMFCGHVPPPPANQQLQIEFESPLPWRIFDQSLWLTGTLRVVKERSEFGAFSYRMTEVVGVEPAGE